MKKTINLKYEVILFCLFVSCLVNAQTIPQVKLNTSSFTPQTFNATPYTPSNYDSSVLLRSVENIQNRQNLAIQNLTELVEILVDIAPKLNEAEAKWFKNYSDSIIGSVKHLIEIGEYGMANLRAVELKGQVALDKNIKGRIDANKDFLEYVSLVKNMFERGNITEDTMNWWFEENEYWYKENIVGWKPKEGIYNSLDWIRVYSLVKEKVKNREELVAMAYKVAINQYNVSLFQEYEVYKYCLDCAKKYYLSIDDVKQKEIILQYINNLEYFVEGNTIEVFFEKVILAIDDYYNVNNK